MKTAGVKSILYLSCLRLNEDSAEKLSTLPMDMILLDLEDAVPIQERQIARQKLYDYFVPLRNKLKNIAIRINSIHTVDGLRDLIYICDNAFNFEMILIPMVENSQDILQARRILNDNNLYPNIFPLIETPRGVENVHAIADVSDGLFYGGADYCSLIGINIAKSTAIVEYATSRIVNAASIKGIPAYDTPCFRLDDLEYLRNECTKAFQQGFIGKQAIHPQQLSIINECFKQPEDRLKWAMEVLDAVNQKNGRIVKVDSTMVGPPFAKLANKILLSTSV